MPAVPLFWQNTILYQFFRLLQKELAIGKIHQAYQLERKQYNRGVGFGKPLSVFQERVSDCIISGHRNQKHDAIEEIRWLSFLASEARLSGGIGGRGVFEQATHLVQIAAPLLGRLTEPPCTPSASSMRAMTPLHEVGDSSTPILTEIWVRPGC